MNVNSLENMDLPEYVVSIYHNIAFNGVTKVELIELDQYMTKLNYRAIELSTLKRVIAHWEAGWNQNYVQVKSKY